MTKTLPRWPLRSGVTLIELMIVVCLSFLLTAVIFGLYRIHMTGYLRDDAYSKLEDGLTASFRTMVTELRMAGNGFKVSVPPLKLCSAWTPSQPFQKDGQTLIDPQESWFKYDPNSNTDKQGFRAIFGFDGGVKHADAVTIFKAQLEYPRALGFVAEFNGTQLILGENIKQGAVAENDIVAVVSKEKGFLLEIINSYNNVLVINPKGRFMDPSGLLPFTELFGAPVYNFKDVSLTTYYLNEDKNRLMVAHHDQGLGDYDVPEVKSSVLAENIEDLQLYYYYEDEIVNLNFISEIPDVGQAVLDNYRVKAVAIGMTGRSPQSQGQINRRRPALFNRQAGTESDNNRRATLIELVYLRNFGND
jgi:hypothetical protein